MDSCPGDVYEEVNGRIIAAHQEECHGCHTCEAVCPEDACSIEEE
jgi:NAD-dependent dihydropyrimidine dehydrogenase PreA subunit